MSVKSLMFTFDDLQKLDPTGIQTLLRGVDKNQVGIALKGASETIRDLFFSNMSERQGKKMREDMEGMAPCASGTSMKPRPPSYRMPKRCPTPVKLSSRTKQARTSLFTDSGLLPAGFRLILRGEFGRIDARGVTGAGSVWPGALQFPSRCPILKLPI